MKRFLRLLKIEFSLNIRDMNMAIFAIIMPIVVLVILGFIYGGKPAFPDAPYTFLEQSFGAVSVIAICAGGLMGLPIVIADYREKKILKRFKVTPIHPAMLLGVELAIYILYCIISLISLAIIASLFWQVILHGSFWGFIGSWFLTMISTLSIGLLVGGIAKNAKQASIIASLLYFPMLIFSGTTLPFEVMPEVMQKIVSFFPLTQGINLMKNSFLGIENTNLWLPITIMSVITIICTTLSIKFFKWE